MYEKIEKMLTPVCRLMIALVLFLVGLIWQISSGKTIEQYAFYIMCAAALCVAHVIICKLSRSEADFILYVVLNLAVLILGFALTEIESITGVVRYSVWGICGAVDWIINAALLRCDNIFKRIVMGFASTILNLIFFAIIFLVPILLSIFVLADVSA